MPTFLGNENVYKILVPLIVALLVSGIAPWWWTEIFAKADSDPVHATPIPEPSPSETAPSNSVILDDRLLGKWSNEGNVRASYLIEIEITSIQNGEKTIPSLAYLWKYE
jgi:hypothetical protein